MHNMEDMFKKMDIDMLCLKYIFENGNEIENTLKLSQERNQYLFPTKEEVER